MAAVRLPILTFGAPTHRPSMNPGLVFAALAYAMWGLFPLYLRELAAVDPLEVVLHRSLWALVFVLAVLGALRRFGALRAALASPRRVALLGASAVLLTINWLVYVWAVQQHRVVEASLGYFINPLVSVLLGTLVLHERLRPGQWLAVALAAAGVVWLGIAAGHPPWIALVLAFSFGVYGLIRKTAPLGAAEGLAVETLLLAPVAAALLGWWTWRGGSTLASGDPVLIAWLALAGPLTAVPLLMFAAAARRLSLATLGLMQYLAPTLQFVIGLWVFREPFDAGRLLGFAFIWAGLVVYSAEGLVALRRGPAVGAAA